MDINEKEKLDFEEYFKLHTNYEYADLKNMSESQSPLMLKSSIILLINICKKNYQDYLMPEHPDFNVWLWHRTGHTCSELYEIARATGSYKSYEKMIDWYNNRFVIETKNPFLEDALPSRKGELNESE